jgi:integrase
MGVKVRQKNKGRGNPWWVFISHQGRRISKKVGDKKAAEEVASQIRSRLNLGQYSFDEEKLTPTFKQYSKSFFNGYSRVNHKKSTRDSYRNVLDLHILPEIGKLSLNEIRRKTIKNLIFNKQQSGLSSGSVRIIKAYTSSILAQAVDDEIIPINPASRTGKFIKKDDSHKNLSPLSWEEKAALEGAMKTYFPRYYPFFICALRTGMREGELIALKPGDIDFNSGFIEIKRNCVRGDITTPKNGKTRRVDMTTQLMVVLKEHLTTRKRETLKKGWKETPEWLFYNEVGQMINVGNLRKRVFYKCLEKAGLRRITIHQLRHTYATLRIQAGHNIADVQRQLGHHSIKVTVDTYYHYMPGTGNTEVNDLDQNCAPIRTLSAPSHDSANEKGAAI